MSQYLVFMLLFSFAVGGGIAIYLGLDWLDRHFIQKGKR